jgi:toxin YoeB
MARWKRPTPDLSSPTVTLLPEFLAELEEWVAQDRRVAIRIYHLMNAVIRDPLRGIGRPVQLRQLGGTIWSRRITEEHRLLYEVGEKRVTFIQCSYRY